METLDRIVAEHAFFAGLESYYLSLLVGCASNVRFDAGAYLFKEGAEANEFYLIRAGRVAVEVVAPQHEPIIVSTLGPGDILGWSWLVPPYHWRFHARAVESTRAFALDGRCLRTKCEQNHDLGYELLKRFAQVIEKHLVDAHYQLAEVSATGR